MTQINRTPYLIGKIKTEILNKHFYCYHDKSIFTKNFNVRD